MLFRYVFPYYIEQLLNHFQIFDKPTRLFSQVDVPLIVDVLPLFEDLQLSLEALRDDMKNPTSPVLRVAAQAALLMVEKYSVFTTECEMYYIAIGMCYLYLLCYLFL